MDPIKYPSPVCPLCKEEDEDEYHFVVGCHLKWEAWKIGLDLVQHPSPLTQPLDIWQTLLLQHRIEVNIKKRHPLVSMSIVWAAIWKNPLGLHDRGATLVVADVLTSHQSKDFLSKRNQSYSIACRRYNCSLLINKLLDYKKDYIKIARMRVMSNLLIQYIGVVHIQSPS
jgi:hypothetical protein